VEDKELKYQLTLRLRDPNDTGKFNNGKDKEMNVEEKEKDNNKENKSKNKDKEKYKIQSRKHLTLDQHQLKKLDRDGERE
jgi:hypothetical protein